MTGSLPPNLILSLVFGAGQIVVGGWLAAYPLAHGQFWRWRQGLMVFVGLWFVVSGVVELVVSGMEASQRLTGAPAAAVFTLWRGRADTALFVASALLACGALLYPLALRWFAPAQTGAAVEGETGA
jgi:hypothetical protein